MTYQNRMSLDMLLAEHGGVCAMFQDTCCTFIPNNAAPDGSVTRALLRPKVLSIEAVNNSGIRDWFSDWFTSWFGRWGSLLKTIVVALLVGLWLFVFLGCFCILFIQGLTEGVLTQAVVRAYMYQGLTQDDVKGSPKTEESRGLIKELTQTPNWMPTRNTTPCLIKIILLPTDDISIGKSKRRCRHADVLNTYKTVLLCICVCLIGYLIVDYNDKQQGMLE